MKELFKHNQRAYEAVMARFNAGNDRAAVVHATGTGKSYIGGAVAEHFNNVLIVAPNEYVLNQAASVAQKAECRTYSWISQQDTVPTGYDLIWFDEFHRMGAETWSVGCQKLIDANPQAKILGSTATSERSLEQRDMADEWFENSVVSTLTLSDAWVQHILRVPIYVTGVISMDDTKKDYALKIKNAKRINEEAKTRANVLLNQILLDWSNSYGVPRILRKYIDKDVERIVVFAQSIQRLKETVALIPQWFKDAGIELANIYYVHSGMGSEAMKQMKAFENDNSKGVKVLVSVDMLNEGIHVDRVDAVILFRSTISKNLYMQQIGRCFAVGQKHQPIILDFADNLTSACGYNGIYEARNRFEKEGKLFSNERGYCDTFQVIDTLKETRDVIAQIDNIVSNYCHWEKSVELIKDFYERNGHFPRSSEDCNLYEVIRQACQKDNGEYRYPNRVKLLESIGFDSDVYFTRLPWIERYNKVMKALNTNTLTDHDSSWIYDQRKRRKQGKLSSDQIKLLNAIDLIRPPHLEPELDPIVDWVKQHGTLPRHCENKELYRIWYKAYHDNSMLWEKLLKLGIDESYISVRKLPIMDRVERFYKENGYLPRRSSRIDNPDEHKLYISMVQRFRYNSEDKEYAIKHWGLKEK